MITEEQVDELLGKGWALTSDDGSKRILLPPFDSACFTWCAAFEEQPYKGETIMVPHYAERLLD